MIRASSYTVTFVSPFTLPGLDRLLPAGSYTVETEDENLDVTFAASRRVATTIILKSGGVDAGVASEASRP